jgi:hypothetical protein
MEIFKTPPVNTDIHKSYLLHLGQKPLLENNTGNPEQDSLAKNPLVWGLAAVSLVFSGPRKMLFRAAPFIIHRILK